MVSSVEYFYARAQDLLLEEEADMEVPFLLEEMLS